VAVLRRRSAATPRPNATTSRRMTTACTMMDAIEPAERTTASSSSYSRRVVGAGGVGMDECGSAAGAGRLKAGAVEEAHLRCWLAGRSGVVGEWKRTGEQRGWWPGARPAAATGRFLGGWRASVCPISSFVYCIPSSCPARSPGSTRGGYFWSSSRFARCL
jgi:hypothetical protein